MDIFYNFQFTDRDIESNLFKDFLTCGYSNVLIIKGESGVGKTRFINEMMKNSSDYSFISFNASANQNSNTIIENFINELAKHAPLTFLDHLNKFYKNFGRTWQLKAFIQMLIDGTIYITSKRGKNQDPVYVIKSYIEKTLNKQKESSDEKKLFICIDNFHECPMDIIRIFFKIFSLFSKTFECRFCIIVTSTFECSQEFTCKTIHIERFSDKAHFRSILFPIYDHANLDDDIINKIYLKCQGNPGNLIKLTNLLMQEGGIRLVKKPSLNVDVLNHVITNHNLKYNKKLFDNAQKWVLFSFLCLGKNSCISDVKDLALYIAETDSLFKYYTEATFNESLLNLINKRYLNITDSALNAYCQSDYWNYLSIFQDSPLYAQFSFHAYIFLKNNYRLPNRDFLLCKNMKAAEIENWQKETYHYGIFLYKNHLFYDAAKAFNDLENDFAFFTPNEILTIALTYYEIGNYKSALRIMRSININQLADSVSRYKYLLYFAKSIYNSSGNLSSAIDLIKKALTFVAENSKEYIHAQNLLQMYYIESPNQMNNALKIFENIRDNYKDIFPDEWARAIRCCHVYIKDNTSALELLNTAIACTKDELEKAYLETSVGFIYVRTGNFEKAQTHFEISYNSIKQLKFHEASYAANNLAVCFMIKQNYSAAKEILQEALLCNKTHYGEIVLNMHYMLCNVFIHDAENQNELSKIMDYVSRYSMSNPGGRIMRCKLALNLAVAYKEQGNSILFDSCLKKASEYAQGAPSEWRYNVIKGNALGTQPTNPYYSFSKFDPWFLIYAHD